MCYNCGCGNIYDDMGQKDNIIEGSLKSLSEKSGKSLPETKLMLYQMLSDQMEEMTPEIVSMFELAAKAESQSVEEAKKNTRDLLKNEVAP